MKKTITLKLLPYIFPVLLMAVVSSCKKDHDVKIEPVGKYENGFFIINEGSYGTVDGSVSFFDYTKGTLTDSIFTKENTGKNLDPNTSTLEFGTVYNHKLYLLSKSGGPLVVTDDNSLKETGRIAAAPANDWRAFVGIDNNTGLVSTGDGIYPLNLQAVTLGSKIAGVNGEVGDLVKAGNYVFALSKTDGVVILNASTYAVVKSIPGMVVAFARSKDGAIWAAGGKVLVRIDPSTLAVQNIPVSFTVNDSWGAWHPGSITASTTDNAIFLANNNGPYNSGGTDIYKYTATNSASFAAPFITIPAGKALYGAGLAYSAKLNQLVVTAVNADYSSGNDLYFYDTTSGSQIKDVTYPGYFFPATPAFH
ncbi:DUF5074 domain-containing protein [Mucilaginibacter sp. SP1R1]|uniref:DUF5074 domain-containing protein n=1 Tax=Mucilaginibacter sp. SP1R1 TaxID=2723091 RepID=UPI00160ED910|nr:DUF5074 domain-containing protein [Mucilaginibacter sp. SP1R1]MBB6149890.1 hypothetical protein [Mucilaginibacter sp. SP1R1]